MLRTPTTLVLVSTIACGFAARAEDHGDARRLAPIPATGAVPPIVDGADLMTEAEIAHRALAREYTRQIRVIRRTHFGSRRAPEVREAGLVALREFVDPASFRPMIEELSGEADDVRRAMLDHFVDQGDEGQAGLVWLAIHADDETLRNEAVRRLVTPPADPVLRVLDTALRSNRHVTANRAGAMAGTLGALRSIPLLIFSMATRDPHPSDEGDLAWIAIQTQVAYVQNVVPVVGDSSGAFAPVVGVINEGVVMRAVDAVVIVYRTEVHGALVRLTTEDFGASTAHLGYDMRKWWLWYNEEYVPYKNEQARLAGLGADDDAPPLVPGK